MSSLPHLLHFNYWAVLVCALLQWFLGAAWYSPALFAKPWMADLGIVPDPTKRKGLLYGMTASFIGSFIASFVLLHFILWSHSATWLAGARIGLLCWVGFIAAPSFAQGIYERRSFRLFAINSGYWLAGLLLSGAILAVWR